MIVAGTTVKRQRPRRAAEATHRLTLRDDLIAQRRTQADVVRVLAEGRQRLQPSNEKRSGVPTVTLSFTANHMIDQLVQDAACRLNLSRSAVIRQAIMHYHAEVLTRG